MLGTRYIPVVKFSYQQGITQMTQVKAGDNFDPEPLVVEFFVPDCFAYHRRLVSSSGIVERPCEFFRLHPTVNMTAEMSNEDTQSSKTSWQYRKNGPLSHIHSPSYKRSPSSPSSLFCLVHFFPLFNLLIMMLPLTAIGLTSR